MPLDAPAGAHDPPPRPRADCRSSLPQMEGRVFSLLGDGGRCGRRRSMRNSQSRDYPLVHHACRSSARHGQDAVGPSCCCPRPSRPMTLSRQPMHLHLLFPLSFSLLSFLSSLHGAASDLTPPPSPLACRSLPMPPPSGEESDA